MTETWIEKDWITEAGLRAVIVNVRNSHNNGYIILPHDHPAYGKDYSYWSSEKDAKELTTVEDAIDNIKVHGGLTFASNSLPNVEDKDIWIFGFDTAHAWDQSRTKEYAPGTQCTYKNMQYVEKECEALAKQFKRMESDQ